MGQKESKPEVSESKRKMVEQNPSSKKTSTDNSITCNEKIVEVTAGSLWDDIRKYYKFKDVLGGGHFGTVRMAYKRSEQPRKFYAIKSIAKKHLTKEDLENLSKEVDIISQLDHPNIIKFLESYQDKYYFHIVMELCQGKEVFEKIIEEGCLTEHKVCEVLYKVLTALNYCHNIGICHRDVKPENILFENEDNDSEIKLIDFGLSKKYGMEEKMHTILGTPYYVAPEVLNGEYDQKCDIWSVGAIAYIMLSGEPPFNGSNNQEIFKKILNHDIKFDGEKWEKVSLAAKSFIIRCLTKKPEKRFNASQALQHEWFNQLNINKSDCNINEEILINLKNYTQPNKLKRLVMKFLINDISKIELKNLKEAFFAIDVKKQGFIRFEELETAFSKANIVFTREELLKRFKNGEKNGKIDYSEFLLACSNLNNYITKEKLNLAFKYFDIDDNGIIDIEDLRNCLMRNGKKAISQEELQITINEVAKNDSKVSYRDFIMMFGFDIE